MRKAILFILVITVFGILTFANTRKDRFITVEGADLRAKLKETLRLRQQIPRPTNFWVAYSFDVKPGMAIDAPVTEPGGETFTLDLATGSLPYETRNVGIFLLYTPDGRSILRGDLYNLDRQRDYDGHPVYWLGRGGSEESLGLLQEIVLPAQDSRVAKRLTEAIAVHNHPLSETTLRNIAYRASDEQARLTAITWLGRNTDGQTYLVDIARNEQLSLAMRKRAISTLVENRATIAILLRLYSGVSDREVKDQIIRLSLKNENKDEVVNLLRAVVTGESDTLLRSKAISSLGQIPGKHSLYALSEAAESPGLSTELQKEAVRAISLNATDEAVSILIRIATSHAKAEVRQEAIRQLGRRPDERAQRFLRELHPN